MKQTQRPLSDYLSPVVQAIPPSGIRKFFDLVANSRGVISLGVGEPDFVTPWHIREAAIYSIEQGRTTYTSNYGLLELRQEIAAYLERERGVRYDPHTEILVTVGVAEGIDLSMRALCAPGDEVIVPQPCFVSYGPCVSLAGGTPVYVQTREEDEFKLTTSLLAPAINQRTKAMLIGYPNNPTGAVMTRDELAAVAALAEERDLLVVSDEIYAELTYDGEHTAFSALPGMRDRTVLLGGFSKAFAMTGWRLGYAAGPAPFIEAMTRVHQHVIMCAPITAQMAALEALRHGAPEVQRMRDEYDRRRRLMLEGFGKMGLPCFEPRGAFYIFPNVSPTGLSGEEFALRLLQEKNVAVVPGSAFGSSGAGHVRCAYAASLEKLTAALERMAELVQELRG